MAFSNKTEQIWTAGFYLPWALDVFLFHVTYEKCSSKGFFSVYTNTKKVLTVAEAFSEALWQFVVLSMGMKLAFAITNVELLDFSHVPASFLMSLWGKPLFSQEYSSLLSLPCELEKEPSPFY